MKYLLSLLLIFSAATMCMDQHKIAERINPDVNCRHCMRLNNSTTCVACIAKAKLTAYFDEQVQSEKKINNRETEKEFFSFSMLFCNNK